VTRFYTLGPGHIFGADKASHFKFGLQIERKNCLSSTSILMKYVGSLILLSGYFVQLCVDVGITVYVFHKTSLGTMHYVVLDHFLSV